MLPNKNMSQPNQLQEFIVNFLSFKIHSIERQEILIKTPPFSNFFQEGYQRLCKKKKKAVIIKGHKVR